jgi:rod shape determining protein RodA
MAIRVQAKAKDSSDWLSGLRFDPWMALATILLLVTGLMAVFSSAKGQGLGTIFPKQVINFALGIVPFMIFWRVAPQVWQRAANWLWVLNVALLAAVLVAGSHQMGAQRWIAIGSFQFQPSELSKILTAITLATFFSRRHGEISLFRTFVQSFLHILPTLFLVIKQPHLGGTLTILAIWLAMSVVAGIPWKFLFASFLAVAVIGASVVHFRLLPSYMMDRIDGMKVSDDRGKDYQVTQASIAYASGGVFGKGYLKGEQKSAVPMQWNDFIFSVIGEEGGLTVCLLVLASFGLLYFRMWLALVYSSDYWGKLVVAGILTFMAFHTFVNIGMTMGMLPVVGLWLPFMSFGGTAMWLCLSAVALVQNVYRQEEDSMF